MIVIVFCAVMIPLVAVYVAEGEGGRLHQLLATLGKP